MVSEIVAVVSNRVRVVSGLTEEALYRLKAKCTYANPEHGKWLTFRMGKRPPEAVRTWGVEKGFQVTIPLGELAKLQEVAGPGLRLDEHRARGRNPEGSIVSRGTGYRTRLFDFQERMVGTALERANCLWRSPPGSGKTESGLGLIHRLGCTSLVIVPATALLDQWVRRCGKAFGMRPDEVGIIKGNKRVIKDITIAMDATLRNCYADYASEFGLVLCDEVQRFASPTLQVVVDAMRAKRRLGVSADETRADGMEFLIYSQFGEVAAEVQEQELIERGFILDVEVRVVPTEFKADWYKALDAKNKYKRHDDLLAAMTTNEPRLALVDMATRWCLDEGEQVLVLSQRREPCFDARVRWAREGIPCGLFLGTESNRAEFLATQAQMEAGTLRVVAGTYQAIGVGFDLPRLARGVMSTPVVSGDKSQMQFRQYKGRFARTAEGKRDAAIYYLWDHHVYGAWPLTQLCRWNTNVKVWVDGEWVAGGVYAREVRKREREAKTSAANDER